MIHKQTPLVGGQDALVSAALKSPELRDSCISQWYMLEFTKMFNPPLKPLLKAVGTG